MFCTTTTPTIASPLSLFTTQDLVEIVFQGVIIEKGRLFVFLTDGRRNYTIEPKARALTSFLLFQQYLMDELNLIISHRSQNAPSSRQRRHDWGVALRVAFDRGVGV